MASHGDAERARDGRVEPGWEQLLAGARVRARSLCRNTGVDPDDLVQEAFARLLLDPERVRDRAAWLARVMANLLVSELRRQRVRADRRRVREARGCDAPPAARIDLHVDLRRQARRLSESDRECLRLYLEGHSHREIGLRLAQPAHRVGPRIARALRRLRVLFERS